MLSTPPNMHLHKETTLNTSLKIDFSKPTRGSLPGTTVGIHGPAEIRCRVGRGWILGRVLAMGVFQLRTVNLLGGPRSLGLTNGLRVIG